MIPIKTKKQIDIMRQAGRVLAQIMSELEKKVEPGIATKELDRVAQTLILKYGAEPGFKGHDGFPASLCTAVNSQIVHTLPSDYQLKQGDVLSLDLGIKYKGFYSDMATTLILKNRGDRVSLNFNGDKEKWAEYKKNGGDRVSRDFEAARMVKACKKALKLGIIKAMPGNTIGDIGNTIQRFVEDQGFNVARELCGHGIGKALHEDPKIPNYGKRHSGEKIKPGMVFCIEPMITIGDWHLKKSADGFGYETKDGSLSAHFEHTVAILENRQNVLTKI